MVERVVREQHTMRDLTSKDRVTDAVHKVIGNKNHITPIGLKYMHIKGGLKYMHIKGESTGCLQ